MKTNIAGHYQFAAREKLVSVPDRNALARARRAYQKNLADPGDCAGDSALLIGLAIAQADLGIFPGWLPEVQRVGCAIARLLVPTCERPGLRHA